MQVVKFDVVRQDGKYFLVRHEVHFNRGEKQSQEIHNRT